MPPKKKTAAAAAKPTVASNPATFPMVSVLTPTYNRRKFIPLAIQMFKAQSYPQDRMEWIILDDGTDKVGDLFAASGLTNVRYHAVDSTTKLPIGAKRNRINELAKGEICVAWDDDDYYPPDRVKNAVGRLRSVSGRRVPVTGSTQMYLYYTDRDEIWNIGPYNPNHCTNGTMAYWRTYFKEHRYDDTAEKAEERVFMDNWRTPVLQLKPEDTMLVICHSKNTFDKRILLEKSNPTMKKLSIKMRRLVKDKKIADFYLSLKDDFKAEDASGATAPTFTAEDLNPALQFSGVPAPSVELGDVTALPVEPVAEAETTEATPELVMEELTDASDSIRLGDNRSSDPALL
jgi:glycosyltransferase involved in cell wall biosynthesis